MICDIKRVGDYMRAFSKDESENMWKRILALIDSGGGGGGVTGVKGDDESTYRTGNVNLTAVNVGALPSDYSGLSALTAPSTGDILPIEHSGTTYKIDYNALAAAILARLGAGSDNIVDVPHGGTGANNALSARTNLESAHAGFLDNTINVDNLRATGLYYCAGCSATGIDDNGLWGQLLVISSGPWNNYGTPGQYDRICQVFFYSFQNNGQKWIQYRIYDSAWSSWRVLLDNYGAVPVASGGTGANTRLGAQHELMAYGAGVNVNDNPATYGAGIYHLGNGAFDTSYWPAASLWGVMMIWSTQYYAVALILHSGTTIYRGFKDTNATTFAWKSAQLS